MTVHDLRIVLRIIQPTILFCLGALAARALCHVFDASNPDTASLIILLGLVSAHQLFHIIRLAKKGLL